MSSYRRKLRGRAKARHTARLNWNASSALRAMGIKASRGDGHKRLAETIIRIRPQYGSLGSRQIVERFVDETRGMGRAPVRRVAGVVPPKGWIPGTPLPTPQPSFHDSAAWRSLRYRVLKKFGRRCMCCGATPGHGAIIQVDHIKPRSKYPELALVEANLQVLCRDCNLGKVNHDEIDWRTAPVGTPQ